MKDCLHKIFPTFSGKNEDLMAELANTTQCPCTSLLDGMRWYKLLCIVGLHRLCIVSCLFMSTDIILLICVMFTCRLESTKGPLVTHRSPCPQHLFGSDIFLPLALTISWHQHGQLLAVKLTCFTRACWTSGERWYCKQMSGFALIKANGVVICLCWFCCARFVSLSSALAAVAKNNEAKVQRQYRQRLMPPKALTYLLL